MPKSAWPVGDDVLSLLNGIPDVKDGLITVPSESECDDIAEGVVDDFQAETGRIPFLSTGTASNRTFNPPKGLNGLFRIPVQLISLNSVTVDVYGTNPGVVFELGTEFFLEEANAPALGRPYEIIHFMRAPWGPPQSVIVNAVWGYGLQIPMDAWQGVRREAAKRAIEQTMGISGPLKEIKQLGMTRSYGARGQRSMIDDLADGYAAELSKYTFIPCE